MAYHVTVLVSVSEKLASTSPGVLPDSHLEAMFAVRKLGVLHKDVVQCWQVAEDVCRAVDASEVDTISKVGFVVCQILCHAFMSRARALSFVETPSPCNIQAIALDALFATPTIRVSVGLAIDINP